MSLDFEWDNANILHIARHNVTPEEVEEALSGFTLDTNFQVIGGEERSTEIGVTHQGRFLEVVSALRGDRVRVITAYDASKAGIQEYLENK